MFTALIIGIWVGGIITGLVTGRLFCKWHHKNDENDKIRINSGAGTRHYPPGHPLGLSDDVCGPHTIGDKIEDCKTPETWTDGSQHPGCGPGGCCKD